MEPVNENKIGIAKGTELENVVKANFKGEATEVVLYLAMARCAQREGYPEIAEVLKTLAFEEATHGARFAELNGEISTSTEENLKYMLEGERMANKEKREAAVKAKELGLDELHDLFDESSRDEARHARALEGLLKRYFG
ncbi:MAG: rubrerythrin family protein [Candidatus Syntrophoarchaeum sp. WYZ-LMO15]|nr:MAG: rubrerythrin family protein [Candidatus Syntrophoarchaeum sp. WYZ-LMO15]